MPMRDREVVFGHVRTLFREGALGGLSDRQLLDHFLSEEQDAAAAAFEVLIRRHGPMVFGVCRCVLRDLHATEDAFQATFLVLVRKARSIREREALGLWLHGVARRVAIRAKVGSERRRKREQEASTRVVESMLPEEPHDDEHALLHEELGRLPEKYRAPLVLCYLQGMTYDVAARSLRVSPNTLRGRLARAREKLRRRFESRAVKVESSTPLLLALPRESTPLSQQLVDLTSRSAMAMADHSEEVRRLVDAKVVTLVEGVLRNMLMHQGKLTALIVLAATTLVLGAGNWARSFGTEETRERKLAPPARVEVAQAPSETQRSEREKPAPEVDGALIKLVPGRIVQALPLAKDGMVLSYLPDWNHGNVDNIAVANNDGGVRTLVDWPEISSKDLISRERRAILAFYARETTAHGPAGSLEAYTILEKWPERVSWQTLPSYQEEPAARYTFTKDPGWKLFDVTPMVLAELKEGRKGNGLLLKFAHEDRSGTRRDWSGYQFHSREAPEESAALRPRLLIVESAAK